MSIVCITGHSPDMFDDPDKVKRKIEDIILLLKYQYGSDLILLLGGNIGIEQWACECAINLNIPYHIYIPYPIDILYDKEIWYKDQIDILNNQIKLAKSITICSYKPIQESQINKYKKMVDDSSFIVAFWQQKHQGYTYSLIKYAIEKNKMTLNGFQGLSLILKKDLFNEKNN